MEKTGINRRESRQPFSLVANRGIVPVSFFVFHQHGDKPFHPLVEFPAAAAIALVRWQMTALDDEIQMLTSQY